MLRPPAAAQYDPSVPRPPVRPPSGARGHRSRRREHGRWQLAGRATCLCVRCQPGQHRAYRCWH